MSRISICSAALVPLVLFFGINVSALGAREAPAAKVLVSGKVRMVGSGPTRSLVISGENREWYVEPQEQKKLINFQQQTVRVQGREYFRELTFANGMPAGRQYYLKDIKIIRENHR